MLSKEQRQTNPLNPRVPVLVMNTFKGGVSKTTTALNIAWDIVQDGKTVLLVDADPQCNLTQVFLNGSDQQGVLQRVSRAEQDDESVVNIGESLDAVISGNEMIPPRVELIDHHLQMNKLFLLPGHVCISEYEQVVAGAIQSKQAMLRNSIVAFDRLVQASAKDCKADIVLIDTSPSMGTLNFLIVMFSDYLISPCQADYFSEQAMKTFAKRFPVWLKKRRSIVEEINQPDFKYRLPARPPKFLGAYIQMYTIQNSRPAQAYQSYIVSITSFIQNGLVAALDSDEDVKFPAAAYEVYAGFRPYILATVKNFNRFAPMAQGAGVPLMAFPNHQQYIIDSEGRKLTGSFLDKALEDIGKMLYPLQRSVTLILHLMSHRVPHLAPSRMMLEYVEEADYAGAVVATVHAIGSDTATAVEPEPENGESNKKRKFN